MSFNLKKYSTSGFMGRTNTPQEELYNFNLWSEEIKDFFERDDFEGLKGYIQSKEEIGDMDFGVYLRSNISHYGYLLDSDKYLNFLEVLKSLGVVR
jgi:hypothetical protein